MQNKSLRNHLAAEYVIGTLVGAARRRFEYYINQDPSLQALIQKWGHILNPMGSMLKPVTPPKRVWKNIEKRLLLKDQQGGFWNNLFLWRTFASTGAALVIVMGIYLGNISEKVTTIEATQSTTDYLAVIQNTQSQGAWVISTDIKQKRLVVRNIKTQEIASGKDFELWLLPDSNNKNSFKAPISVGLIDASTTTQIQLTAKQLTAIQLAGGVAVSLEPSGGSTTGLPTGPVLYQGKLQLL